ncbi:MAG: LptE family protein [Bacteroidota bacterium]|nr:LptE family protein [Bacteroidota bacterium]
MALALFSCKVKYGFKGISIPPEAKTISVIYFQNNASMANPVEAQKFTEKLRDMVSAQTNLALTKQNGDLQFEGYIADYSVIPVAIQSTDQAALNRLTVTIHVKYSSKLEPAKNFEQNFSRFFDYSASKTLTTIESEALDEINRQITEDVFQKAFNNW